MKTKRRISDRALEAIAIHFKLLGEPMRLRILQTICVEPHTVTEIVKATGATQANVSKHLALLASAKIVTRKKDGQFVYYGLTDPLTLKLCDLVHSQIKG